MTVRDDTMALLDDADEQIAATAALHDQALSDTNARRRFRTRIKNVLENQRSSLDYLAVAITKRYGTPGGMIYYPLANSEPEFPAEMERKMPGVAANEPGIAAAIKQYQPYAPAGDWLRELNQLTREQKHNQLSLQLVRETYQCRVTEKATGAYVQWRGLTFEQGVTVHDEATASLEVWPPERWNELPLPFLPAESSAGPMVFGFSISIATQRPISAPHLLDVESGAVHQWCFVSPHRAVVVVLANFQVWVRNAVKDISQAARL